jgi:hypothetical protein
VSLAIKELQWDIKNDPYALRGPFLRYTSFAILLVCLIIAAGLGGWRMGDPIQTILSQKHGTPVMNHTVKMKIEPVPVQAPETAEAAAEPATLFLDKQTSLYTIFDLYDQTAAGERPDTEEDNLHLYSLDLAPEYHVMFKKPFRIHLATGHNPSPNTPRYVIISRITENGAVAIDSKGGEQPITRDFIITHWGNRVSWVYSTQIKDPFLIKGMREPDVTEIQKALNKIGYTVPVTGYYGDLTSQEIMKFQKDFGIAADGVAGPQTRALLYQMAG